MNPPKILGREIEVSADGSLSLWFASPRCLLVPSEIEPGFYVQYIGDNMLVEALSLERSCAAIERELLAIRAAIPEKAPA